ncbi:hypothetical protein NBRC10512_005323 [Rhodotorula toruloides]
MLLRAESRLLRFKLDSLTYDISIGGLAPILDIWVPLKTARDVANSLGRLDELAALLDWQTRRAWSVEDKEEGGLVHNWKISSDLIDPQDYSTASMLDTPFARIELLSPGSQVRTLLPPLASLPAFVLCEPGVNETWDMLWSRIVEWSVREYEGLKDRREEEEERADLEEVAGDFQALDSQDVRTRAFYDSAPVVNPERDSAAPEAGADRFPPFFASSLSSLLALLHLIPNVPSSTSDSPSSSRTRAQPALFSHLPHIPPLPRSSLASPSPLSLSTSYPSQQLYLLDTLSRLFIHAYRSHLDSLSRERFEARRKKREGREREKKDWRERVEGRLRGLEGEVLGVGGSEGVSSGLEGGLSAQLGALEEQVERLTGMLQTSMRDSRAQRESWGERRLLMGAAFVAGLAVGAAAMAASAAA